MLVKVLDRGAGLDAGQGACRGAGPDAGQGVRACRYHKLGAGLDTAGACRFSLWFFLAGSGVSGLIGASLVSLVLSVLVLLVLVLSALVLHWLFLSILVQVVSEK